jgi:hypothetical protein
MMAFVRIFCWTLEQNLGITTEGWSEVFDRPRHYTSFFDDSGLPPPAQEAVAASGFTGTVVLPRIQATDVSCQCQLTGLWSQGPRVLSKSARASIPKLPNRHF